jgi:hypothetical protein
VFVRAYGRTQFSIDGRKGFVGREHPLLDRIAVGRDLDRAGEPRLHDTRSRSSEPSERFRVWVAVRRDARRRDDRQLRVNGREERRRGGAATAVVRDLEHVGGERPPLLRSSTEEAALAALLDVAREQDAAPAERDAHDERAVVSGRALVVGP